VKDSQSDKLKVNSEVSLLYVPITAGNKFKQCFLNKHFVKESSIVSRIISQN